MVCSMPVKQCPFRRNACRLVCCRFGSHSSRRLYDLVLYLLSEECLMGRSRPMSPMITLLLQAGNVCEAGTTDLRIYETTELTCLLKCSQLVRCFEYRRKSRTNIVSSCISYDERANILLWHCYPNRESDTCRTDAQQGSADSVRTKPTIANADVAMALVACFRRNPLSVGITAKSPTL